MAQTTMADIARKAGVTVATVSLALRGDPRLKSETCARIQKLAVAMGYESNPIVNQLMSQLRHGSKSGYRATLAFISPLNYQDLARWHTQRDFIKGATERAKELGYKVDFFHLFEQGMTKERLDGILTARNIKGILIPSCFDPNDFKHLECICETRASVIMGSRSFHIPLHSTYNDQFASAFVATQGLFKYGYRAPALLIDKQVDYMLEKRFSAGFIAAHADSAKDPRKYVAKLDFPFNRLVFLKWLTKLKADSLISVDPQHLTWLTEAKIKVPKDMGYVNLDLSESSKKIAGIQQNSELVGIAAIDLVVGQIHRNEFGIPPFQKVVLIEGSWREGETIRRR